MSDIQYIENETGRKMKRIDAKSDTDLDQLEKVSWQERYSVKQEQAYYLGAQGCYERSRLEYRYRHSFSVCHRHRSNHRAIRCSHLQITRIPYHFARHWCVLYPVISGLPVTSRPSHASHIMIPLLDVRHGSSVAYSTGPYCSSPRICSHHQGPAPYQ